MSLRDGSKFAKGLRNSSPASSLGHIYPTQIVLKWFSRRHFCQMGLKGGGGQSREAPQSCRVVASLRRCVALLRACVVALVCFDLCYIAFCCGRRSDSHFFYCLLRSVLYGLLLVFWSLTAVVWSNPRHSKLSTCQEQRLFSVPSFCPLL